MNAIFLTENKLKLTQVYEESLMARLCRKAGAQMQVYDKADVLAQPEQFQNTKLIFSTWGMPVFTEEEIREIFPKLECLFYAAGTVFGADEGSTG